MDGRCARGEDEHIAEISVFDGPQKACRRGRDCNRASGTPSDRLTTLAPDVDDVPERSDDSLNIAGAVLPNTSAE